MPVPSSLPSGFALAFVAFAAQAQTMPPTTQQLQQRHDQTMRDQTNAFRQNQAQSIQQNPAPPQPVITPSGRAVTRQPGHIATPGPGNTDPDR